VPIVLVTGDATTAEETERFCPGIKAAVVKKSITRFSAEALHPTAAKDLIREQARLAVEELPTAHRAAIDLPATLEISFRSSVYCELASRIAGVKRTGDLSASIIGDDPLRIYQTFITVVLLCRGLVE
jgi:D-amino peptidase